MNFLRRLVFDFQGPFVIAGLTDLPTDEELRARNEARAKELAQKLGEKWVLHPANQPARKK